MKDYSFKISQILNSISKYPKVLEELENELKHFLVYTDFIEFENEFFYPYNLNIHFHKFSKSKKNKDKWYCRYYIYTEPGCLSFKRKEIDYSQYDKKIYLKILEIAETESTMFLLNE